MNPKTYPSKAQVQKVIDTYIAAGGPSKTLKEISELIDIPERTLRRYKNQYAKEYGIEIVAPPAPDVHVSSSPADEDKIKIALMRNSMTLDNIADKFGITRGEALDACDRLKNAGVNLCRFGEHYSIHHEPAPREHGHVYESRPGGYYKFGYTTDNHLCSKYAREDILNDLYDWFAAEHVDCVFNSGNYIDGEARFNKHDIFIHGMQNQLNYFCENYPQRPGIVTKIVSGDDHEGWYGQREGVDIGWLMEQTAKRYGRTDLINLGYVESFVTLQHHDIANAKSQLLVAHPGGGSAYATSYAPQKYVEALQGGEKPAVILFGHWHKIFDLLIRNVICLGGGCTKDLDPFGRKNKLAYHLGGIICELWQDESGAITRWRVEKKQYFDRGYYNNQWSYEGRGPMQNAREAI